MISGTGVAAALALIASPVLAQDSNREANRLVVDAVKAWQEAEVDDGGDFSEAAKDTRLLIEVRENLQSIVDDHPGSDLAVRLIVGESVGPLSLKGVASRLDRAHDDLGERMDACTGDFLRTCVMDLVATEIRSFPDAYQRAMSFIRAASVIDDEGLFVEAAEATAAIDWTAARNVALEELAISRVKSGFFDEGLATALSIPDYFRKDNTLTKIVRLHAEAGRFAEAEAVLRSMDEHLSQIEAAGIIAEVSRDEGTYEAVRKSARELTPRQRVDILCGLAVAFDDIALLEEARRDAEAIEGHSRESALAEIAVAGADMGQAPVALEIARTLQDRALRAEAIAGVAEATASRDLFREAIGAARESDFDHDRWSALAGIAAGQARSGFASDAIDTLRGMEDASLQADAIEDISATATDRDLLQAVLEVARSIEDPDYAVNAQLAVAEALARGGWPDDALGMAARSENELFDAAIWQVVATSTGDRRIFTEAAKKVLRLRGSWSRAYLLSLLLAPVG